MSSIVFSNVGTFKRALPVLNEFGIGFAIHNCHEYKSHEFSLEQHSRLRWGVQETQNPYDMAPYFYDSDHNALRLRCEKSGFILNSFHVWLNCKEQQAFIETSRYATDGYIVNVNSVISAIY